MKYLTFILSIYILALSFVMCTDTVCDDLKSGDLVEEANHIDDENHSHSNDVDLCSPFCSCQCCQVIVDVFHFPSFDLSLETILLSQISFIKHDVSQDVLLSLYQPPIA